jgi:hypothetical protein
LGHDRVVVKVLGDEQLLDVGTRGQRIGERTVALQQEGVLLAPRGAPGQATSALNPGVTETRDVAWV